MRLQMYTPWLVVVVPLLFACGDDKNLELTEAMETSSSVGTSGGPGHPPPTDDSGESTGLPETTALTITSGQDTSTGPGFTGEAETSPGSSSFIQPFDGGTGTAECSVWTQNCGPGEKCTAWAEGGGGSWNATKCVPVMERPKQPGEPCMVQDSGVSGIDDCDLGGMCWDVGDDLMGTCVALCTGSEADPMCEDPETLCVIVNGGVLNLCLERCDPLLGDCSQADDLCIADGALGFVCVLDASGDGGGLHGACAFANSCDSGLLCLPPDAASECDPNAAGCCEPVCDLTVPDPDSQCSGVGQQCVAFFMPEMAPAGDEDVGVCAVPL